MPANLSSKVDGLLNEINEQVMFNQAQMRSKKNIEDSIKNFEADRKAKEEDLDLITNAVDILRQISDDTVEKNYRFIEETVNTALKRVFPDRVREIKLVRSMRGSYPQLEFRMTVENGIVRTIKSDSGHGIAQVISILTLLTLIVIKGERRFLVLDEMTSGMSGNTRYLMDKILWSFADIGFQFVLIDHGYIPKGSHVYAIKNENGVGKVVDDYIEEKGVYNEGRRNRQNYKLESIE